MTFPFALVVFDLDGTLVDSGADIAEALNRTLADFGLARVPDATVLGWIGEGVRKLVEAAWRHAHDATPIDAVMPTFMRHYEECLLRSPRLYPGAAEALAQLRTRGVTLALCTNKPSAFVPPLLRHLGVADAFAATLGGDSLPERKPSPLPLLHLAQRFAQPPARCLMVGDSGTDLQAAHAAGMPAALVRYGYPRDLDLASAEVVLLMDDMRELLTLG
ncbi:phosphoglycolate phosphatase [Xanthomonas sp. NCPPB 2654]|uniref:phosphoglycolate phosphatase n=1 Tax=unclassified Xanthomonas TaxID=2643310 RepID=UPI0021DFF4D0|nr:MULTISPECIES: phosphoglycolate phosphatase [unclassified Xanthomonas]MDL5366133.1 phosphoglycolate phosphatase [Xanthomonas sp. NCPPB 2654]UYC21451.1 phosphoglycolate phosphatase [Xanthomonas sp. CFBP 8443]